MIWVLVFNSLVDVSLFLNFYLSCSLLACKACASAPVAETSENELNSSSDDVCIALGLVADLASFSFWCVLAGITIEFFLRIIDVLDNLYKVRVTSPLHDGEDNEEVDSDKGGHCAVETAAGLHHTHY